MADYIVQGEQTTGSGTYLVCSQKDNKNPHLLRKYCDASPGDRLTYHFDKYGNVYKVWVNGVLRYDYFNKGVNQ